MGKVLILGKFAYFEKWKISHLRYCQHLRTRVLELDFLLITFEKTNSDFKNVSSISSRFFVSKIKNNLPSNLKKGNNAKKRRRLDRRKTLDHEIFFKISPIFSWYRVRKNDQ